MQEYVNEYTDFRDIRRRNYDDTTPEQKHHTPTHSQLPGDVDEELTAAAVKFLAIFEDAKHVSFQPSGGFVVRSPSQAASDGAQVDRPSHHRHVSLAQLDPIKRKYMNKCQRRCGKGTGEERWGGVSRALQVSDPRV